MRVKLISKTCGVDEWAGRSIDEIIVGCARISSSREINDLFKEPEKLLRHCILEGHWSIFQQADLGIEIETSRAMGREILRHDMSFQEFSQRYATRLEFETIEFRKQSKNNRQSSTDIIQDSSQMFDVLEFINKCKDLYNSLINAGVARECSRFVLPECTQTTLRCNTTIRNWMSFLNQRLHKSAQKEVRLVAQEVVKIFMKECPIISDALFNFENAYEMHIFDRLILAKYKVLEKCS